MTQKFHVLPSKFPSAPLFFVGIFFLLGVCFVLHPHPIFPLACLLLGLPFYQKGKILIVLIGSCLLGALSTSYRISHVSFPKAKFEGTALFQIDQIKIHESPFDKSHHYIGCLQEFRAKDYVVHNLPCHIFIPFKEKRHSGDFLYTLQGSLEQKGPHLFVFKPAKKEPWKISKKRRSLTEVRFQAKRTFFSYLEKQISEHKTASFLYALATGDVDERIFSLELGKIGVQHLLAVSGFHFGVLYTALSFLFGLFLKRKTTLVCLLLLLTTYWLFLGSSPSIERAWISLSLVLVGQLFYLKISGLNALGAALCIALIKDPLTVLHMGFQLSFLCTLAILLLYAPLESFFHRFLPKRKLSQVLQMSSINQYGYVALSILKKGLSLNLAVHLMTLFPLLFLFHRFPWMSLAYNLFFPFWVSLSIVLLLMSILLFWIPPLSHFLHQVNAFWTTKALQISASPPAFLDTMLSTQYISLSAVILWICFCLIFCAKK